MQEYLIGQGTYAKVYLDKHAKHVRKSYQLNTQNTKEAQDALFDSLYLISKLQKSASPIKPAHIYSYKIQRREESTFIDTIEDYCGSSIRDLLRNKKIEMDIINKISTQIAKLPEDMPIDTHPGNICLYKQDIYLIDFFPAYPYHDLYSFENDTNLTEDQKVSKVNRYYFSDKRIEKFQFYCAKYIKELP